MDTISHSAPETPGTRGPRNPLVAYEPKDVNAGTIFRYGVALLVTIVVAQVIVWGVFRSLGARETRSAPTLWPLRANAPRTLPPEPRLQGVPGHETTPQEDLRQLRQAEDQALHSYAWVDRKAGIARIPIDEAIKLLTEKGFPLAQSSSAAATNGANAHPPGPAAGKTREKKP